MNLATHNSERDCRFIEILTSDNTGAIIGHRLGGERTGPNLLVAGHSPLMDSIFKRLSALPSLTRIRGKIYLITLDGLDEEYKGCPSRLIADTPIDEIILLPYASSEGTDEKAIDQGYWAMLRRCAKLGIISGRGVSATR